MFAADAEAQEPGRYVALPGVLAARSMVLSTPPRLIAWTMTCRSSQIRSAVGASATLHLAHGCLRCLPGRRGVGA